MDLSVLEQNTALLITDFYERRYFSNIVNGEGFVLCLRDKTYYFTDARYFLAVKGLLNNCKVTPVLFNSLDDIKKVLLDNGIKKIGVDFEKTTLKEYEDYKFFGLEIFDCSSLLKEMRSVKSKTEIENIKKSCEICEKSFYETLPLIKKGMTEKEVRDILVKRYLDNGAEGESFDTIVAFNENSAIPHHVTGNKILTDNSVILIDTGCLYNGYASDYTRTFYFGDKPSEEFVSYYNAVWGANELAEKTITSGMDTVSADKVARDLLKKFDLDKYFTHSLGHGLGLEIHEFPTLSPKSKNVILKDGMAFTIEPGVYLEGKFGIRIEDTVILNNGKIERLFTDEKDLIKIK